jgi:hypothetical protein
MKKECQKEFAPLGIPIIEKVYIVSGVVGALMLIYGIILTIFGSTMGLGVAALGLLIVVLAIILYVRETDPAQDYLWNMPSPS